MLQFKTLLVEEKSNNVFHVKLNRPDKHNAISFLMINELITLAKKLKKNRTVRAVIISGEGKSFCAGIDLNDLRSKKSRLFGLRQLLSPWQNKFQKVNLIWKCLPFPVVSIIHGNCFGAGMQLILGSDFRIAHTDAKLSIMEARWGLIPDMGITHSLKELVKPDIAMALCMSAKVFDAKFAKEVGLVTEISESPFEYAEEFIKPILDRSPDAVVGVKKVVNKMVLGPGYWSLALERILQLRLIMSRNSKIAIKRIKTLALSLIKEHLGN